MAAARLSPSPRSPGPGVYTTAPCARVYLIKTRTNDLALILYQQGLLQRGEEEGNRKK